MVGDGLRFAEAPSCGVGGLVEARSEVSVSESADGFTLENVHLRAILGRDGTLRSLVELASGREAMAAPGNVLELYEDRPAAFEAWDLDPFHLETRSDCPGATGAELALAEPLRAEVVFERPIGRASRMRQTVRLDAESGRLEFHCAIDWHEDRRALKVRFPVAVHAPRATYEMQFGVVERPTHYSTRRDLAQYEVPGHRFADLSEHGFGIALLSAATYGWSVHGEDMRMTAPALPPLAGPRSRHRPPRPRLRHPSAPRNLAGRRRHGAGAVLQRAAAARRADRGDALLVLNRHPRPLHRHRQASRGQRRPHRPALRGPRRPRSSRPARRPPVHRGMVHEPPGGSPSPGRGRRRRGRHPVPALRDRHCRPRPALAHHDHPQPPVTGSRPLASGHDAPVHEDPLIVDKQHGRVTARSSLPTGTETRDPKHDFGLSLPTVSGPPEGDFRQRGMESVFDARNSPLVTATATEMEMATTLTTRFLARHPSGNTALLRERACGQCITSARAHRASAPSSDAGRSSWLKREEGRIELVRWWRSRVASSCPRPDRPRLLCVLGVPRRSCRRARRL